MSTPIQRTEPSRDDNQPNTHTSSNEEESRPSSSGNTQLSNMNMSLVSVQTPENSDSTDMPQERREPKTLHELLKFALQSSSGQGGNYNTTRNKDKDREAFMREALTYLSVDVIAEIKKQVDILAEIKDGQPIKDLERYESTFRTITDQVYSIDMANVFYQVGGLKVIVPLLRHPLGTLRWRAASVIAECCQNNPFCKILSITDDVFCPLSEMASNNSDFNCQFKSISAISAIVRDNPEGVKLFRKHNGLNLVQQGLNSANEKIIAKTAFLIMALCTADYSIKDELLQSPTVENLISLIRLTETLLAEHLLSALLALIRNHEAATKECLKKELGFYEYIKLSIALKSLDDSFEEYVTSAKEIRLILKDYKIRSYRRMNPDEEYEYSDDDMDITTPEESP